MKSRTLLRSTLFIIFILLSNSLAAGNGDQKLFDSALKSYVNDLVVRHGKSTMDRERFLVQQLRMINDEMKSRITGISDIRENYFKRLDKLLSEVQALKSRLSGSGTRQLSVFASDVENKIQNIIDSGKLNYKKQKAIEDAVQLLHVAEEMVQLDPNAHLDSNPGFSEDLNKTQSKLQNSFGDTKKIRPAVKATPAAKATVYDVYKEWKKTDLIKYQVRWTDVQIIKRRLFKNGTSAQQEQMFKRELRQASEAFNYGMYSLAERSFSEVLRSYKQIGTLDDVLFFKGQSNYLLGRYHQAEDDFTNFTIDYPSSQYLSEAYLNLMHISFHFNRYSDVLNRYEGMRSMLPAGDPKMYRMTFMASVAALKDGQFEKCIELSFEIPSSSDLYREARYVLGEAYAGLGNYDESKKVFTSLLKDQSIAPEFRFTILLKLGYLSYEGMDYYGALKYFEQIAGTFSEYDRVLIGYGWTLYKIELAKSKSSERDFSETQKYLEALLNNFYGSDYLLEARTLLAYTEQLQENVDAALDDFEFVFGARDVKLFSDSLNTEYDQLKNTMNTAKRLQNKALQKNNAGAFSRAYTVVKRLRGPLIRLGYMDMSSSGVAVKSEVSRLNKQLTELSLLKKKAEARGKKALVQRIENMQLKIYRAVNSVSVTRQSAIGLNYFDAHPLARKESVIENNNKKISDLRADTQKQREEIRSRLTSLDFDIQNARAQKDYRKMIRLELSRERLAEFAKKLDFLDTRAYASNPMQTGINLDYWSNYSAFGMTNVRFSVRLNKAAQIADFQKQIEQINDFLEIRKQNIEHKIEQIDDEITLMTRRVRRQERIREREELKRQFEESYFDTHDTELNYDQGTTQPPKLRDDEN